IDVAKPSASSKVASVVLDASALLAALNAEPGTETVMAGLADAIISPGNYAEGGSKLVGRGGSYEVMRVGLPKNQLKDVDFNIGLADRTGTLRAQTRHLGLSLGDRACLALAERERVPALTTDRSWVGALPSVEIRAIR